MRNVNSLPVGAKQVYLACEQAVKFLIRNGSSLKDAEAEVLVILKEHVIDLNKGEYSTVAYSIARIFSE